ncbi:grasp-with-spasm system SPASM domain peptide maturase [bacterium]|nr:grasp-with-spasm system SPASM domain peptide maturase [bacterium]NUN46227.1 grasp-with-spasm system SPASM domain peptide maturase [bacterium]
MHGNCIPVKGAVKSVICDLQRHELKQISNDVFELLELLKNHPVEYLKNIYTTEFIDESLEFCVTNEFGFYTEEPWLFPEIDLSWDSPYQISNAIIDSSKQSKHNYKKIIDELDELGCETIQFRFYFCPQLSFLNHILLLTQVSRLKSIQLILKDENLITQKELEEVCRANPRIESIFLHSSHLFRIIDKIEGSHANIIYFTDRIESHDSCGNINKMYFCINIPMFTEAHKLNTCLNRKISIDVNGDIKNCPSMTRHFGNIHNTSLHSAIIQKEFKDLWLINKDQIEVCKICEFRYVCTDCRAFITEPSNIYSKPSKCTYDPTIGKWLDETQ